MSGDLVIYGSYGYTGDLVAREALDRGLEPLLAGRNRDALTDQAIQLGCDHEVVALDEPKVLDVLLEDADAVIHCAGPFVDTWRPMYEACRRNGATYLDVSGEIPAFEALFARDEEAREAGVACVPGVGFDVVPTDCLAVHLVEQLPSATRLELAFDAEIGVSPGTARTALRNLHRGGAVRRDGTIVGRPPVHATRQVDFGWDRGDRHAGAIPWGDIATAGYSTDVPNVTVYAAMSQRAARVQRIAGRLAPLLNWGPVEAFLSWLIDQGIEGPDAEERAARPSYVWGGVRTEDGESAVSRLRCPNTYTTTADAAVGVAQRVLDDPPEPGVHTPGGLYGPDLILEVTDAERRDGPLQSDGDVADASGDEGSGVDTA